MALHLPDNLPSIAHAKLPATYEAARASLEKCASIDECMKWADKTAALASYAKQSADESLFKMAVRIRARAIKRCGELLRTFGRQEHSGRPAGNGRGAPTISQRGAARKAGLSKDQEVQAKRVANVPQTEFEQLVESDNPPTVSQLANIGKKTRPQPFVFDLKGRDPADFQLATQVQGELRRMAELAERSSVQRAVAGSFDRERPEMLKHAELISHWLAQLSKAIRSVPDLELAQPATA